MAHGFRMGEWATDKRAVWDRVCEKYGGNKEAYEWGTWGFFDWTVGKAWPTLSSMTKARKFGWHRYDDTYETWIETFKAFENAGILPKNRDLLAVSSASKAVNGDAHEGKLNGIGHGEKANGVVHEEKTASMKNTNIGVEEVPAFAI